MNNLNRFAIIIKTIAAQSTNWKSAIIHGSLRPQGKPCQMSQQINGVIGLVL